ncbi:uncharacterized protein LOC143075380 [Mytilus galloprovincialis]|uniref:uncharacterized protein LOC143075380 n=1 Tax=Mytilus galloprovincialis TaxID=29158 RepID=UPI003F7C398C
MASSSALTPEEENYVRMALLLTGISPRAVRVLFDKEFPLASLSLTVNDKKVKQKLNDLSRKRVINNAQWSLLFPTSGIIDSKTFDVTLMIALLRNLTTLTPPINGYDNLPVTTETTPASDLARIKHYRNLLSHLDDAKVDGTLFTTAWMDISGAVFRLGGNAIMLECDQLKTKPLDMSSQEILRDVQQAKIDIISIKQSLDLIQSDHTDIKTDMKTFKSGHDIFKKSCDLLQMEQTESRKDIVVLKSDHQNLKKSHDLLHHEQTISEKDVKRVEKDLNTLKLEHHSLEKSQGLLQVDQREVRIDVQNVKSACETLKTSQALIQSDQIKTKEDVKKLTSLSEDPVPHNRRVLISKMLDKWQKNAENFVETRAAKCVLKCIKENSCVTVTASSGVGKTSSLQNVALKMKEEEGYDILPITNPNDVIQFYNPNQKTLFVIDDFCGTFSINQSDLDNWEPVMEQIKILIENKLTKIIVACRLQVFRDEKFESLSIFKTSVHNLLTEDLCLSKTEKTSIAELYLETKASEIIQYCDLYDCFPLLCKLFSENPKLISTDFFKNPFSVYENEINNLYKKGHNTKYCVMALCVMFNNNLEKKLLSEEINVEKRIIIENTCEACRLDRGTSRIVLLDELNLLEHTFIRKDQDIFKTKHDKLFDFLAYYFGQKMIQCLIKNANSELIKERFLLERRDDMDQFITIVPPKYHKMYLKRMIDDWSIGRVDYVFRNINWKIQEFRDKFLCYLKKFEISLQRRLAVKTDINNKNTALMFCCYYDDIPFIHWCINHGVCVNLCNCKGWSSLLEASCNGNTESVKILLDNKADINNCDDNGRSSLFVACQNNHKEIVKLLMDNKADINMCIYNGESPLYIACYNNHIETV